MHQFSRKARPREHILARAPSRCSLAYGIARRLSKKTRLPCAQLTAMLEIRLDEVSQVFGWRGRQFILEDESGGKLGVFF